MIQRLISRRLGSGFHRIRGTSGAWSQVARCRSAMQLECSLTHLTKKVYGVAWWQLRGFQSQPTQQLTTTLAGAAPPTCKRAASGHASDVDATSSNKPQMLQLAFDDSVKVPAVPHADRLAWRADALLRLKVRLGLRQDFVARVWPVPLTPLTPQHMRGRVNGGVETGSSSPTVADSDILEALSHRLFRGAASLLEYVLASALRARLRVAINALLAACYGSHLWKVPLVDGKQVALL